MISFRLEAQPCLLDIRQDIGVTGVFFQDHFPLFNSRMILAVTVHFQRRQMQFPHGRITTQMRLRRGGIAGALGFFTQGQRGRVPRIIGQRGIDDRIQPAIITGKEQRQRGQDKPISMNFPFRPPHPLFSLRASGIITQCLTIIDQRFGIQSLCQATVTGFKQIVNAFCQAFLGAGPPLVCLRIIPVNIQYQTKKLARLPIIPALQCLIAQLHLTDDY